jgi:hypothetical protein
LLSREHLDRAGGRCRSHRSRVRVRGLRSFGVGAGRVVRVRPDRSAAVGRLRPYRLAKLSRWTRLWAGVLYRLLYDPDGRPWNLRRKGSF